MIMLLYISHIRWHGNSNGHKSQDHREEHRRFWKNNVIIMYLIHVGLEANI